MLTIILYGLVITMKESNWSDMNNGCNQND